MKASETRERRGDGVWLLGFEGKERRFFQLRKSSLFGLGMTYRGAYPIGRGDNRGKECL